MFFVRQYEKAEINLGFLLFRQLTKLFIFVILLFLLSLLLSKTAFAEDRSYQKPNIVFIISDDQSWAHTSKAGYPYVKTPNFDRIANEGIYFDRTYVTAPSCAPSRVGVLSGLHVWQTGSGALLYGFWPDELKSFPMLLEESGYKTGYTAKSQHARRKSASSPHPVGAAYKEAIRKPEDKNLTREDLAKNLALFLDDNTENKPFMFWIGSQEPHEPYGDYINDYFSSVKEEADFLPLDYPTEAELLKDDFARYLQEIEILDKDIGQILLVLKQRKLLENTIVVVTSDNGMPFPKAKTQNYEYGVRVPLAIRWPAGIKNPGRTVTSMISFTDLAPTFLELAGVSIPEQMQGKSLTPIFFTAAEGDVDKNRQYVFSAYERHSLWRSDSEPTYPRRAIHTKNFTLIRNYFPDRWPSGGPPRYAESGKSRLQVRASSNRTEVPQKWKSFVFDKRPYEELYNLKNDPNQVNNLIDDPEYSEVKASLQRILDDQLVKTADPVHLTGEDYFAQFITETSALDEMIANEIVRKRLLYLKRTIPYLVRPEEQDPKLVE